MTQKDCVPAVTCCRGTAESDPKDLMMKTSPETQTAESVNRASIQDEPEAELKVSVYEEKFERFRHRGGLFLAPVIFLVLWNVPASGLNESAQRLLAIFGLVVTLWITEAIPLAVTALLGPVLCVVCGVAAERDVFRSFGNPILFLFMGSFMLAQGMLHHGLNRRVAFRILGLRWVSGSPARILAAFAFVTGIISMWISNTTAVAMMFPIALAILTEMARRKSELTGRQVLVTELKYGTGLMLAAAFAASIGGMATPIGTPPNLIGLGFIRTSLGQEITFFQWMAFGVPMTAILLLFLAFYMNRVCPAERGLLSGNASWIHEQRAGIGSMSRGERNVLWAFGFTFVLWLLPGIVAVFAGIKAPAYVWLSRHLPEGACALAGAALLFILPVNWKRGEFTLSWSEARHIDWGTILLFGGGLALGEMMFATGLAKWIGEGVAGVLGTRTTLGMIILFTVLALALTETTSNTAAASMLVPIAIAVSHAAGVDALQPTLAVCLAASLAFMLPVSTPPNAVVYGSGCVPLLKMVKYGFILDLVSAIVVVLTVYWLVPLVVNR